MQHNQKNRYEMENNVKRLHTLQCNGSFSNWLGASHQREADKLINQQEGILSYKVINGTYLMNDLLNQADVRHQIYL